MCVAKSGLRNPGGRMARALPTPIGASDARTRRADLGGAAAARSGPKRGAVIAAVALLALMALLAGGAMLRESPTQDEVAHLPAGISYWQYRDLRLNLEHPPLLKMWAALPLVLAGVRVHDPAAWAEGLSRYRAEWTLGREFFNRSGARPQLWIDIGRVPMLLLVLAGGWMVFIMGQALGGAAGGLTSLALYATAPFFLAYGPLVHTDFGVALFATLALWAFGRMWQRPTRRSIGYFGFSLAAALLAKFSAGLLLPAFVVAGAVLARGLRRPEWRLRVRAAFTGVALAAAVTYGFYLVAGWNTPAQRPFLVTSAVHEAGIQRRAGGVEALLVEHPALGHLVTPALLYARGVVSVLRGASRPVFLLGRHDPHGQWFYFPLLLLLKSTPGFLLVMALLPGLLAAARGSPGWAASAPQRRAAREPLVALVCGLVVFAAACIASRLNLGLRHFSVPILLLCVLASLAAPALRAIPARRWRAAASAAVMAGLAASAVSAVEAYPNYLAYFNLLRGGRPAYDIVADSNLDWGQSLPALRRFLAMRHARHVWVDLFGSLGPDAYLANFTRFNCVAPPAGLAGWTAVSAGQLEAFTSDPRRTCDWLMAYPHWRLGGGSMYVFRLPAGAAPGVR
jgi:4-amino-4-deoxy-L-arabinose transferase-like glycosyltransferase